MAKTIQDKQYWLSMAERYFEAETSDEEEQALRQFAAQTDDPDFRDLQAVMGFSAMGRKHAAPQRHGHSRSYAFVGAAASFVLLVGLSLFYSLSSQQHDTGCVAWVNGEQITDPTQVMALMQNTVAVIDLGMEHNDPVEEQLREMFAVKPVQPDNTKDNM